MRQAWNLLLAFFLISAGLLHAQGFGMFSQKTVVVNRLLPPTVNLKGKKIRVEATADSVQKDGDLIRSLLKTKLVTIIQKDPRFIVNEISPETVLKFTITNFYVEKWTSTTNNVTKSAYRGKLEVAYQAIDVATNAALDSENLEQVAGYESGPSSSGFSLHVPTNKKKELAEGSENETRDQLVDGIVQQMGRRIAPLDQPFDAPLPGKKLEPISSLALSNRWGAVEEQAEKMEKFPKPEDDAYRLYLIALAKEAQAYDLTREANERELGKRDDISPAQADAEFKKAQKYLDDAGSYYKQAITANSKEKEFRPGDTRTEEAISIYAKIERFKEENAKAMAAKAAAAAAAAANPKSSAATSSAPSSASRLTPLEQVLNFCSQGIALDSIQEYIASPEFLDDARATKYTFSFSRDALRINTSCKANAAAIQRSMRSRLAATSRK